MQNKGGRKKGVLQKMWKWQIHTFLKELLDQRSKYLLFFFKFSSANLMIMYRCSVIFVTNSCGESWDSSSWVAVHNQWVPVHKNKESLTENAYGPLCNQTVNLETEAKTIQFTEIKI